MNRGGGSAGEPHIVLLGDSIFDNAAYVPGGPDVITQLRGLLPEGWQATLCAVDGAVVADVERQIARVPHEGSHLVVSVGGNDALGWIDILDRPASSVAEVLDLLGHIGNGFRPAYHRMLERVSARGLPVTVCTIYEGALPDPALHRRASTALVHFNDTILQAAYAAGVSYIELRQVCTEPADYANPIEPSVQGGAKIARSILRAIESLAPVPGP